MSVWSELRRRSVFKVAAAYAVLAWVLIQVAGLVFPQLNLPVWAPTLVTVLLIFGFPVAVFLAWAYEVTPEGIKRTRRVPFGKVMPATGQRLNYVVTAVLAIAVAFIAADTYLANDAVREARPDEDASEPGEPELAAPTALPGPDPRKVAILPCENLSEGAEHAHLAAGIHLEIISRVSNLSRLSAMPRTSVLRYAQDRRDVREIAMELGAQAVMECTVRHAGDDLLVTVSLIDPESNTSSFSRSYEGSTSDVSTLFAMQADIATRVANALDADFSLADQAVIDRVPTESAAAYARYLKARELVAAGEFGEAVRELGLAVETDAGFAEAYAHRARLFAYGQITSTARGDLLEAGWDGVDFEALTLDDASRALRLYPRAGLAWVARALTHQFHFRWNEARAAYAQALALSPNDVDVLGEYARFQGEQGNVAEAVDVMRRALRLDPNGVLTLSYWANVASAAGLDGEAAAAREKVVALAPAAPDANMVIGLALAGEEPASAERYLRTAEDLVADYDEMFLPGIAFGYLQLGLGADAGRALDRYEAWARRVGVGAAEWAAYYVLRGDVDEAYRWLEQAVTRLENGETELGYIMLGTPTLGAQNPALSAERFQRLFARLDALKASDQD